MNRDLFYILVILAIILLSIWIYRKNYRLTSSEGFQQKERFLLKTDADSYDDFYSEIYDKIMDPYQRAEYEIDEVLKALQPERRFSTMLDVGSGTGAVISTLKNRGYTTYGIDHSQSMNNTAKRNKDLIIKCDDVENPMAFDRALFTHIFCMNFTIYEIKNKLTFFKNCFYWLQNNGYLILHLAEKDKFNTIIPSVENTGFEVSGKRILKTEIDFESFQYKSEYVPCNDNKMVFKESFKDKQTENIRQNERLLYMESSDEIISVAGKAGFVSKGVFSLENGPCRDQWQQIIILERLS
jgi:ubiquinone/menaquinone biosynthesis C-methylase UbiE